MGDTQGGALSQETLHSLTELYDRGLYLQAYEIARPLGPLHTWRSAPACVLAGKLAMVLGGSRLGQLIHYRGWRAHHDSNELFYYYARQHYRRRGAFATRRLLQAHADLIDTPGAALRGDWLAFLAHIDAFYRDFSSADERIEQALEAEPEDPWVRVEQSRVYEAEDHYELALGAAEEALRLKAWFRPAVEQKAHILRLLNYVDEAHDFLKHAAAHLESGAVVAQLLSMEMQARRYEDAERSLARIEALSPLRDQALEQWLAACRADLYYQQGHVEAAIGAASRAGSAFHQALVSNIERADADTQSMLLDVEFVRQHHMTCGPATLSALSAYMGRKSDHDSIVEAIWYSGTSDYQERRWAIDNGWLVREFRLDWDAAQALLGKGVPFALSTVEPGAAHLQAVVGYDARRRSLLIRDPFESTHQEFLAEQLMARYASSGPRAMVLIPPAMPDLLEGLELPESELYDAYFNLQQALEQHQREEAGRILAALEEMQPEARLSLLARRALAVYDNDLPCVLETGARLLERYPEDVNLQLEQAECLRRLGRVAEHHAFLRRHAEAPDADALILIQYADLLAEDARNNDQVRTLLKTLLGRRPAQARAYYSLARLLWGEHDYAEAVEMFRLAASLEQEDEHYARSYFKASRFMRQGERALHWLEARYKRLIAKSAQPAFTLYQAYEWLGRAHEGLKMLEQAMRLRPEDGELLLFCADAFARNARRTEAQSLLARAEHISRPSRWLAVQAEVRQNHRDLKGALADWRRLVELEPHALYAHRNIAHTLHETEGRAATLAYLETLCERQPYNHDIYALRLQWLDRELPHTRERVLRKLLELNPRNAWALRQLAQDLAAQGQLEQGFETLEKARALDPESLEYLQVYGDLLLTAGRGEEARDAYREAIRHSVDCQHAIAVLLEQAQGQQARREVLAFVKSELVRQVTHGDGLLVYQAYAQEVLEPQALLDDLKEAWEARPDLWHSWSALTRQNLHMGRLSEALAHARHGVERFPLLPLMWLDLAQGYRQKNDAAAERRALISALEIAPDDIDAQLALAENYEREGEYEQSKTLLKAAVLRQPANARLRAALANVSWLLGEREVALEQIQKAVVYRPEYTAAWDRLSEWAKVQRQPELPRDVARALVSRLPGDAQARLVLAQLLDDFEEALAVTEDVIALEPYRVEAHELHIKFLTELERYDEAIAAVAAGPWGEAAPVGIRGLAPWVMKRRGRTQAAVTHLKGLLAQEPGYALGWRMLAAWDEELGDAPGALEACRRFVDLRPNDPVALVYLGNALEKNGDSPGAQECFRRALTLVPDDRQAGESLFELQLRDGDTEAAEQTLALMHTHAGAEELSYLNMREVQLACAKGEGRRAVEGLTTLCHDKAGDLWPLQAAMQAFVAAGWQDELNRILYEKIRRPAGVNPNVGLLWAQWQKERGTLDLDQEETKALLISGPIGINVVDTYLDALNEAGKHRKLHAIIRGSKRLLHANVQTWATIGYIYAQAGRFRKTAKWMHDWQERRSVPSWGLNNLAIAYRELGRWKDAWRVGLRALESDPGVYAAPLRVWVGLESGLIGDIATLNNCYEGIDPRGLNTPNQFVYHLLMALRYFEGVNPVYYPDAQKKIRALLRKGVAQYPDYRRDRPAAAMRRRVIAHIADRMGGVLSGYVIRWRLR